jgi:hypothetical protein
MQGRFKTFFSRQSLTSTVEVDSVKYTDILYVEKYGHFFLIKLSYSYLYSLFYHRRDVLLCDIHGSQPMTATPTLCTSMHCTPMLYMSTLYIPALSMPTLCMPTSFMRMLCTTMPCIFYVRNNSTMPPVAAGPKPLQQLHANSIVRSAVLQ